MADEYKAIIVKEYLENDLLCTGKTLNLREETSYKLIFESLCNFSIHRDYVETTFQLCIDPESINEYGGLHLRLVALYLNNSKTLRGGPLPFNSKTKFTQIPCIECCLKYKLDAVGSTVTDYTNEEGFHYAYNDDININIECNDSKNVNTIVYLPPLYKVFNEIFSEDTNLNGIPNTLFTTDSYIEMYVTFKHSYTASDSYLFPLYDKFKNFNFLTLTDTIYDSTDVIGAEVSVIQFNIGEWNGKCTMFNFAALNSYNGTMSDTYTFTLPTTFQSNSINFNKIIGQSFQQKGATSQSSLVILKITGYNTCTIAFATKAGDPISPNFTFFI